MSLKYVLFKNGPNAQAAELLSLPQTGHACNFTTKAVTDHDNGVDVRGWPSARSDRRIAESENYYSLGHANNGAQTGQGFRDVRFYHHVTLRMHNKNYNDALRISNRTQVSPTGKELIAQYIGIRVGESRWRSQAGISKYKLG